MRPSIVDRSQPRQSFSFEARSSELVLIILSGVGHRKSRNTRDLTARIWQRFNPRSQ